MVKGVTPETLDGISVEWFEKTSKALLKEHHRFKPNRRIFIPKANGKLRPLGIATPRDKVVQQAMNMVMETILEPKFHDTSHGFRPSRGCHSALRHVRN
jgi:retron-type reverse transcriptase